MLTHIKLENFKSWRNLDIELAPLTLLFGTNSSGKTAILQSLLLLKQTANNFDRKQHINFGGSERDYVDFGSWRDVIFGHKEAEHINIGLEWRTQDKTQYSYPPYNPSVVHSFDKLSYSAIWRLHDRQVVLDNLLYRVLEPQQLNLFLTVTRQPESNTYTYEATAKNETMSSTMPAPESGYALPNNTNLFDYDRLLFTDRFTQFFEQEIKKISYLGPLRHVPKRSTVWSGVGTSIIEPDGNNVLSALIDAEEKGVGLITEVAKWLSNMGLVDKFQIDPLDFDKRFYETQFRVTDKSVFAALQDIGFGVSQVLPVVTLLFLAPEGSIILLEQPELHLHPNAQSVLADLLLEVAEKRNLQLIVESHSEHLLTRLQRRIAEPEPAFANPDNIKMYFCQIKDGESKAEHVVINQYGQIENWPENFFGDRGGDLDAMTDAALARRREELEHSG